MKRQQGSNKKSVYIYSHDYRSCCSHKTVSAKDILINERMQKKFKNNFKKMCSAFSAFFHIQTQHKK